MASTIAAILFASAMGNWIDRSPTRLPPLLITVYTNHGAIILAYLTWLSWPIVVGYQDQTSEAQTPFSSFPRGFLFGLTVLLDIIHDLSAIANRLSIERDWVPVLVGPITPDFTYGLTQVNAVMRRLDLISKLVAPSLLPFIIAIFNSREAWILLIAGVTAVFWAIEIWCAKVIARENPELHLPKKPSNDSATTEDHQIEDRYNRLKPGLHSLPQKIYFVIYQDPLTRLKHYFSMSVWPASISESVVEMTVLAYSSTLITYLLEVNFSLTAITIARASGTIMALASTFITPIAVKLLRKRRAKSSSEESAVDSDAIEGSIVRTVGIWGISSQVVCMVRPLKPTFQFSPQRTNITKIPVVAVLWNLSPKLPTAITSRDFSPYVESDPANPSPHPKLIFPLILFTFLSLSRVGHFVFGLMVQEIEQVEIPTSQRSTFAGTAQSFHSMFVLGHWAATVVWSKPEQFKWLALGSLGSLTAGMVVFAAWMRRPRRVVEVGYEEVPLD